MISRNLKIMSIVNGAVEYKNINKDLRFILDDDDNGDDEIISDSINLNNQFKTSKTLYDNVSNNVNDNIVPKNYPIMNRLKNERKC